MMFTQIIFSSLHTSLPLNLNRTFKGTIVEHVVVCLPCFLKNQKNPTQNTSRPQVCDIYMYICICICTYGLYVSMCIYIYAPLPTYIYLNPILELCLLQSCFLPISNVEVCPDAFSRKVEGFRYFYMKTIWNTEWLNAF